MELKDLKTELCNIEVNFHRALDAVMIEIHKLEAAEQARGQSIFRKCPSCGNPVDGVLCPMCSEHPAMPAVERIPLHEYNEVRFSPQDTLSLFVSGNHPVYTRRQVGEIVAVETNLGADRRGDIDWPKWELTLPDGIKCILSRTNYRLLKPYLGQVSR